MTIPPTTSAQDLTASPLTFDMFHVNERIGTHILTIDHAMMKLWKDLYGNCPEDCLVDTTVPMGTVPLLLMQAFATIVVPRPPGNLHVGQSCIIHAMPEIGKPLNATVDCASKEKKGTRNLISFRTHISDTETGYLFVSGITKVFWTL